MSRLMHHSSDEWCPSNEQRLMDRFICNETIMDHEWNMIHWWFHRKESSHSSSTTFNWRNVVDEWCCRSNDGSNVIWFHESFHSIHGYNVFFLFYFYEAGMNHEKKPNNICEPASLIKDRKRTQKITAECLTLEQGMNQEKDKACDVFFVIL